MGNNISQVSIKLLHGQTALRTQNYIDVTF